jgi:hypothetical protein
MTTPAVAASRLWYACLMGGVLGLCYSVLRPLRPKYTAAADLAFLAVVYRFWLELSWGICRGDFRISYLVGMAAGFFLWEAFPGKLLQGVFAGFWKVLGAFTRFLWIPGKIIFSFMKKMFASGEKWVTIGWNHRRHMTRKYGGPPYGRNKETTQPDPAGSDAHTQSGEDLPDHRHCSVHVRSDRPAHRRERSGKAQRSAAQ